MLSLRLRLVSVEPRRDPSPTVWSYRYQRLMLTPLYRFGLRVGAPVLLVVAFAWAWFANDANRSWVTGEIAEWREAFEERPEFLVTGMDVTGANAAVRLAIEDIVTLEFPTSSWRLDLDAIRTQVTELTAVKDATVRVRPGGVLEIAVTERIPVAVWRYTDGLRLIDAEGAMTGMIAERADRSDLPLIAGDGAKEHIAEALELFAAAKPIATRVRGLVRMGERRWDMVLDRDQRIMLPEENAVAAMHRVVALDQAQEMLARDVVVVDMRLGARPTLRLNQPALNVIRNSVYVEPLPEE
jgi:cell division protein FtsQ